MCVRQAPGRLSSQQIARSPLSWRAKGRGDRKDLIVDVVLGIGFLCSIIVGAVKMADVMYVAF
jgi:hypothetical protein